MLGSNDGFNNRGQVVNIRKSFYTKEYVIKSRFPARGIFRGADNCEVSAKLSRLKGKSSELTVARLKTFIAE